MATNEEILAAVQALSVRHDDMRKDVCEHLHTLDAKTTAQDGVLATLADQVAALTEAKRSVSLRTRELSDADLEQQAKHAQLASELADLKTTNATQLAILSRLDKVTSNPTLKLVATVLAAMFLQWAASKGMALK